jgi:3-dehydroquinate synthase
VAIISDENVALHHSQRLLHLDPRVFVTLKAGESFKNLDTVRLIYDRLLAGGIDRQSTLVALGGGVVGDTAGFAAATYMRGIDYVSCPTTVLSMVDASVGGKTGVDLPQGKNLVGAFKQPLAVVADLKTLDSLPAEEFSAGLAEVVKHGLLAAPALLDQLEAAASNSPGSVNIKNLQALIVEAILVKRDVVEADPFELGRRMVLNLGHTFAHAIEQASGYQVSHGRAVAIGLVAALHLSAALGTGRPALQERVEVILAGLALPTRIPGELQAEEILRLMGSDKKKVAGRLQFVLLKDIGRPLVSDEVPDSAVLSTLRAVSAT